MKKRHSLHPRLPDVAAWFLMALLTVPVGCGDREGYDADSPRMSELEQLRYDRITSQLSALSDEAVAAEASGSDEVLGRVLDKVRSLSYDFNPEQMNDPARDMCQALKDSIELLVESPELVLHS